MRLHLLIALSFCTVGTAQGVITVLEGANPSALDLVVYDESKLQQPPAVALAALTTLPIEITHRTHQQSLRPDRARRIDRDGVIRIELPGNGMLLKYRRAEGATYGYLWLPAGGAPVVLLELPAIAGPAPDPFADRIGVAHDGQHAAITSTAGALWLARLDGGTYASGGAARAVATAATVDPVSLTVGPTHAFFQTEDDRMWRIALSSGAAPQNMTPAVPAFGRLKEEMALSGDGSTLVFLYGPAKQFRMWMVGAQGSAVALPPPAAKYEEPGYLPETPAGPRMMLNENGSRLLYTDATNREEIYLLDTTGQTATTHVTSDANFKPYIGIGVIPAFSLNKLTLAVGDAGAFDWFEARTGQPAVTNLTQTGSVTPPFAAGALVPTSGYDLGTGTLLAPEINANGVTELRAITLATGQSNIAFRDLRGIPTLGRGTAPNVLVPTQRGDSLIDANGGVLVPGPAGIWLSPDQTWPGGGGLSIFLAGITAGPTAAVLRLPGGALYALPPDPGLRQALFTPGGGLLLNASQLIYVNVGGVTSLSTAAVRVVL